MPDKEKVIEALVKARTAEENYKPQCAYFSFQFIEVLIDLLKDQETDAEIEGGGRDWWYVCGECRAVIDSSDSYCSKCGRRIRWKRLEGDE